MIRVGTDLVSIERIDRSIERFGDRFLRRYLSAEELATARSVASLAGYWAAKEAIAKALGCGIGAELSFHDIRLEKNPKGAPSFRLTERAARRFPVQDSSLSISHDGGFAIAVAIVVLRSDR
ncbi:holo-ACP synthase [Nitratifractor sp.]